MNVLVVGGGGREHALVWKLGRSPRVEKIYCAPGNAGIGELAELVPLRADDVAGLVRFAREKKVDLTVVGPELPLTLGIVDEFERHNLKIFGPGREAARLEGSKAFAKELCRKQKVPTGFFGVFSSSEEAKTYVREVGAPVVVKADGLAAGKGVFVCRTVAEAEEAIQEMLEGKLFGDAGSRVVVEEFLEGEEASFMALVDGMSVLPLASSQDHKRAFDGDTGPNTGGMGAFSPSAVLTDSVQGQVLERIVRPVLAGLEEKKIRYRGVLYAGLMVRGEEAKVLEFNVRFGDPECQVLMLRLRSDLLDLLEACVEGRLEGVRAEWDSRASACVVMASAGYPGPYQTGVEIEGLEEARKWENGVVFHAGTALRDGRYVTAGGRVLAVTALGSDVPSAVQEAYRMVEKIRWDGVHYRKDIGRRAARSAGDRGA
ncbi:MAG: phosphoribosylamine--glycine ligase [Candidatus Binatia bacterium]|nr:MAG: phosphoribosylamine--glycine ligase [Candidatus Binatia bacterium]